MSRNVRREKIVKISRLLILKCFKGNGSNFIIDARRNGKPVKGTKNRSNGVETTGRWNDCTSKRVLDKLEAMDGMKRETKEKRIAVVKFSGNKSIGTRNSGRAIKNRADLAKLANVIRGRRANGRDVLVKR